jgi:tetratricopeptide (TPR) repeat protein
MAVPRDPRLTAEQWRLASAAFLDAVELSGTAREGYLRGLTGDRAWLRPEVEALLAAHESAEGFLERAAPFDPVGTRVGPWRLSAEIGRGGMGVVYAAERDDEQFERRAAVKVVLPELWTPELTARFRSERRILARLEHPNIAQLLDSGVSAAGLPYIVMELVNGLPITVHAVRQALDLGARLRLFRAVCAAVSFAHQRLVVHRDIKPGNVLVTTDGDVKLLDFGIARFLPEGGSEATGLLARRLTPEYASPEQLRGEPISTASDVYSLGALLFELVSGRRAFDFEGAVSFEEVVRRSSTDEPPPLGLGGRELSAIVARALRKDPDDRYGSVAELSGDVESLLAGRPVAAWRRSFGYVARKFVARHRVAAASAALFALSVAGGVAGVAWQARIAERERARAQQRFDDVRRLAGSVLFELHDSIVTLPGATGSRRLLVERAREYLELLAGEAPGNPALQLDLAETYLRVGNLQGRPSDANLGDSTGALASYARAQAMLGELLAADPGSTGARDTLARVHAAASDVHLYRRELPQAAARARECLAVYEALAKESPGDEAGRVKLARGYFMLARIPEGRSAQEQLDLWRRAGAIYGDLLRDRPGDPVLMRNVALVHKSVGGQLMLEGHYRGALDEYRKARALDAERVRALPDDAEARLDLTFDLSEIGSCHEHLGEIAEALDHQRQALAMRERLVAADAADVRVRLRLVYTLLRVGWLERRRGDAGAARRHFEAADRHGAAVLAQDADDVNARAYRAEALLGRGLSGSGGEAGCGLVARADALFRPLGQSGRLVPDAAAPAAEAAREAARCAASPRKSPAG